jgi:AraC-like DNA-binding protein
MQAALPTHFGLECIAAAMRNTLGGLLGDAHFPLRFEFPYAAPPHRERYREVLGEDLHFNRPLARWSFATEHLARQLPSSNPALRQLYEAECARLLADLEEGADLAAQSRRLLRKLEGQYPKMPQIAAMLHVSPRTYRRRLALEGTSYQQILDEVRAEHATRHLRGGRLPIASIAYQLGFNDPSNFRRAYRRWTGHSPSAVRAAARTPAP